MTLASSQSHRPAAPRGRGALVAWLLAVVLLFQLLVQTQHDHAHASKSHHCVACALHATPLAGPPAARLAAVPTFAIVVLVLQPLQVVSYLPHARSYLLPPAHAPPVFLLS